jgi:mannosyl-3-phosphoglycerate phosphatase
MKKIIFTDLDGTLVDKNYSFGKALPALNAVSKTGTPLVFCTSKTRAETELYRKESGNKDPFVVENGGAIFIPKNYFGFDLEHDHSESGYLVIRLGTKYAELRRVVETIRNRGIGITGFGDMTPDEISRDCFLPPVQAKLAKKREYDEPFRLSDKNDESEVVEIVKQNGLNLVKGGTFYHITGRNDKGDAVRILSDLYRKRYNKIITYGFGDSENDFGMLKAVNRAYLVKRPDGSFASEEFERADGVGPEGWNKTVLRLLKWE